MVRSFSPFLFPLLLLLFCFHCLCCIPYIWFCANHSFSTPISLHLRGLQATHSIERFVFFVFPHRSVKVGARPASRPMGSLLISLLQLARMGSIQALALRWIGGNRGNSTPIATYLEVVPNNLTMLTYLALHKTYLRTCHVPVSGLWGVVFSCPLPTPCTLYVCRACETTATTYRRSPY
jgi:hypothetical protein